MQVIKYYLSENQAHWLKEIGKGDWSAAELLHDWLEGDKLKQMFMFFLSGVLRATLISQDSRIILPT